jgi:maleate cis-trans isomerase
VTQISYRAVISVPANNTTMEPELNALLPRFAPFAVARVVLPSSTLTLADLPAYTRNTLDSLAPFLSHPLELVVYGCTAAGFLAGPAASLRIMEAMRAQSGAAVVGTGAAMAEVLEHEGVRETAVVTPYLSDVNDGLRAYLASCGIAVEVLDSFECRTTEELGRIDEAEVMELALRTVTPRSRALFIACSQLPTRGILEPLRKRLGIPVWSSISATAWAAARAMAAHAAAGETG